MHKGFSRGLASVLVVLMWVLFSAGCSKELSGSEIAGKMTAAMQQVKNYRVSSDARLSREGGPEGSVSGTVTGTNKGIVDLANAAFDITSESSLQSAGLSVPKTESRKTYLLNNKIYSNTSPGLQPTGWGNREARPDDWKQISSLDIKKTMALLEGAGVKLSGEETVDGAACYILDVSAQPDRLYDALMNQPGTVAAEAKTIPHLAESTRTSVVKLWVAKGTYLLARQEYRIDQVWSAEDLGMDAGGPETRISASVIARFSDYNSSGPVAVPHEPIETPTP